MGEGILAAFSGGHKSPLPLPNTMDGVYVQCTLVDAKCLWYKLVCAL